MEKPTLSPQDFRAVLAHVALTIKEKEAELNALDSAIGDGDHGITMRNGFDAVAAKIAGLPPAAEVNTILEEVGYAFMDATGGAIGIILGKGLVASGQALTRRTRIGLPELKLLLAAMEENIAVTGKTKPGDKTILDAVHAANGALASYSGDETDLAQALAAAAEAAERAAQATADMLCLKGRASRLGERALGHPDPGAVSFGVILRAIHTWVLQHHSLLDSA